MKNKFDFLEYRNCNICNSNDYKVVYSWPEEYYSHEKYETCAWDGREKIPLKIVKCKKCGLVYTNPSFKEEYLYKIYPEDLSNRIEDKNRHLDKYFDLNRPKTNILLNIIREYKKSGVLCDIGTRYGAFPYVANKKYGYKSFGIEYNKSSVDLGRDRFDGIYQGIINDLGRIKEKIGIDTIDIVVMDDVLEHLSDPARDLKAIAKNQKKGGLLFLRQMDFNSLGRIMYGKNWSYFSHAHMYYFSRKSIRELLNKCGYRVISVNHLSLIKNIFNTFKKKIRLMLRKSNNKRKKIKVNTKGWYIKKRKKASDDISLVVAKKVL